MKDYITIETKQHQLIKAEIVMMFKLKDPTFTYLIYQIDSTKYVAKFKGITLSHLDSNLTKNELHQCELKLKEAFKDAPN